VSSILPFLFVLGVLVFVHELGHFLVARWHGVRVLTFSLGFGPKILSIRRGETEYCISVVPLGGYVKMAGESPDSEDPTPPKPDEFLAKTKWQRFQVYVAGPLMNVVTAIVIMAGVYVYGAPEPAYQKDPAEIGRVAPGSPAERAGIRPGDVILSVNRRAIRNWEQLQFELALLPKAGREIDVRMRRDGHEQTVRVSPQSWTEFEFGDIGVRPWIHAQIRAMAPGVPGHPAAAAGLLVGDVILEVNGTLVDDEGLLRAIKGSPGKPIVLTIRRAGARRSITVTPAAQNGEGRIGIELQPFGEERLVTANFTRALRLSVQRNVEWSTLIFRTFGGLFKGEASPKQLMGPVGIAQLSGAYARLGLIRLFELMAMLSVNLAILNLLPIPMLDGGHIFIMTLEGAARRDFSLRVKERMLMAGFVLIMMLMVTVIYNDLMRIDWIQNLVPWR
jgi:regulator of sigma E protease